MVKRVFFALTAVAMTAFPSATFGREPLPPNVTTKPFQGGHNMVIDAIDYSFQNANPVQFSRVKMCIAENVTNDGVRLSDHAGSFVGYGGTYYQTHNSSTVQGGDVFKYVDDASKSLVARSSIGRRSGFGGLIGLSIRFDLEASVAGTNVNMKMMHVGQAQTNTGSLSNDGYQPIGIWTGSMYKKDIQALDDLASQLKACFAS